MPPFTEDQKAVMREQAWIVLEEWEKRHIPSCPWGLRVSRAYWIALGAIAASGLANLGPLVNIVRAAAAAIVGGP